MNEQKKGMTNAEKQQFFKSMKEENSRREIIVVNLELELRELHCRQQLRQVIPVMQGKEYAVMGMDVQHIINEQVPKIISGNATMDDLRKQIEDYFIIRVSAVDPNMGEELRKESAQQMKEKQTTDPIDVVPEQPMHAVDPGNEYRQELKPEEKGRVIDFPVTQDPVIRELRAERISEQQDKPSENHEEGHPDH